MPAIPLDETDLIGGLPIQDGRELCHDVVQRQVPRLPHGVLEGGREGGVGLGGAVVGVHDALGQEEVAEEAGHQEVLPEQLLEQS